MKSILLVLWLWLSLIATTISCSTPRIVTAWKKHSQPVVFSKILSAYIIKEKNDSLRASLENKIALDFERLGYNANSLMRDFGSEGLANFGAEETYLKLCNRGIDAVFLVTLIDKSKESQFIRKRQNDFSEKYYYNRIWNYKNIQADLTVEKPISSAGYFWEAILFNLNTLETECVIQSATFHSLTDIHAYEFKKKIIQKMIKENILKNRLPLKAF